MTTIDFASPTARRRVLRNLIAAGEPIRIPGAHDVLSAKLIEQAGFPAILVSGFGLSASSLGLPDMGIYTRNDNVGVVRNVVMATTVPLMADIDEGYGAALGVMRTVREFELAGASSITLEDQRFPKHCPLIDQREDLLSIEEATGKLRAAVAARTDPSMLIIARTDARTMEEAIARAKAYADAGADLVKPISAAARSVQCLREVRDACGKPLSISMVGWLADDEAVLRTLGGVVAIATYPMLALMTAVHAMQSNLAALRKGAPLRSLPAAALSEQEFRTVVDTELMKELERRYAA